MVSALICGVVFTGCDSEEAEKTVDGLFVFGVRSGAVPIVDKRDFVFSGDDIISFNIRNGEIVFTESTLDEIVSRTGLYSELSFYIDNKPVFVPPITIHSPISSVSMDDLEFRIWESKIYLREFYQRYDWMPEVERERKKKEQEETAQKRKKELEVFIKYLSETGKIIDRETPDPFEEAENGVYSVELSDTIKNTESFYHTFVLGDEEGATIIEQAKHYEKSELTRNAGTNMNVLYHYKPVAGFKGQDCVVIEVHYNKTGVGPADIQTMKINFTVIP